MEGRADVVAYLLSTPLAAEHLTAANRNGCTPCYVAARRGHAAVVDLLAKRAVSLSTPTDDGDTPAWIARRPRAVRPRPPAATRGRRRCYQGHVGVARLLRRHGCSLEHANRNGATPLYAAAQQDQADVVAFLLESGVAVDAAMADGRGPRATRPPARDVPPTLRNRLMFGRIEGSRRVLEAEPNARASTPSTTLASRSRRRFESRAGWGPAHIAAMNGHARVVALLVAHGADVHREARDGSTPANLAAAERHDAVVALCAGAAPPAARGVDYADI